MSLEYLKKAVRDEVDFLHADKHQSRARQIAHMVTSMHVMCTQRGFCVHEITCK